jgi:hypothetical protein
MPQVLSPVSMETYKMFAKKYKIKLSKNKIKKPINILANEIKQFEMKNYITNGLYF